MINKLFEFFQKNIKLKLQFTKIYKKNLFEGDMSSSGMGSSLIQTKKIRIEIPKLIKELGIKTILDAPCGDYYWMKELDLDVEEYIGVDIVKELIKINNKKYKTNNIKFRNLNIISDKLPEVDLILCRDCFVHLNFKHSLEIIKNFKKSGSKYLLITTFVNRKDNIDLTNDIFWRTLNLELEPFNFGRPLRIINEGCTEVRNNEEYSDKSLGLWYLDGIKLAI